MRAMGGKREKWTRGTLATLSDQQLAWLRTGVGVRGDAVLYLWKIDDEKTRAAWEIVGADLLAEHIKRSPGTRPFAWWKFVAPERRRRVGGTGTLRSDIFKGWKAMYFFGVPKTVSAWIIDRDVRLGVCAQAFSESDPPTFESEASFLKRLNLLVPGESKRIPAAAYASVPVTLFEMFP